MIDDIVPFRGQSLPVYKNGPMVSFPRDALREFLEHLESMDTTYGLTCPSCGGTDARSTAVTSRHEEGCALKRLLDVLKK